MTTPTADPLPWRCDIEHELGGYCRYATEDAVIGHLIYYPRPDWETAPEPANSSDYS